MAHDWVNDPRPLADCLKEWQVNLNGGTLRGSRPIAQAALGIKSKFTYDSILKGRGCVYEGTVRRLMTLLDDDMEYIEKIRAEIKRDDEKGA